MIMLRICDSLTSSMLLTGAGTSLLVPALLSAVLAGLFYLRRSSGTEEPRMLSLRNDGPGEKPEATGDAAQDAARIGPAPAPVRLDALTGLPDLQLLREMLPGTPAGGTDTEPAAPMTLLTITLSSWKASQPSLGRTDGDRALVEVAHTVRSVLRSGDTCVRGNAGDIMALLPGLDPLSSSHLVTRVKQAVHALTLVTHSGGEIRLGVTVGRAFLPQDGLSLEALLDAARQDLRRTGGDPCAPTGGRAEERLQRAVPIISN